MLTIESNDDSGCSETDVCSQVSFTCPAEGGFVVFSGAYDAGDTATCEVAVMTAP
ncbi:hypothetical protein JYT86_00440 [bacterium AH-315-N03]|nr:hypothetical protein [bacterium AH-315-N03]